MQKSKQQQAPFSRYYWILRIVLILLIIGRILGMIGIIMEFNKPVDKEVIDVMNSRGYKSSVLLGSVFDIVMLIIFYKIINV